MNYIFHVIELVALCLIWFNTLPEQDKKKLHPVVRETLRHRAEDTPAPFAPITEEQPKQPKPVKRARTWSEAQREAEKKAVEDTNN